MKQLQLETNQLAVSPPRDTAALLIDVVPVIMRYIRNEMRSQRLRGLSVPQFRTLVFLSRNEQASLSQVAEHIGVTLGTTSKLINALVERRLVIRMTSHDDRRYVRLKLSKLGMVIMTRAREGSEVRLAKKLGKLSTKEQVTVSAALLALRASFGDQEGLSVGKDR